MQFGLVMRAHAASYDDGRLRLGLLGAASPARGKRVTWLDPSPARGKRVTRLDPSPARGKRVTWLAAGPARGERVTWLDASLLGYTPGERGTRRGEC
jgi:hypothetical protein